MEQTSPLPTFRHLFQRWLILSICLPTALLIGALSIAIYFYGNAFYDSAKIPQALRLWGLLEKLPYGLAFIAFTLSLMLWNPGAHHRAWSRLLLAFGSGLIVTVLTLTIMSIVTKIGASYF
jgi:hypothetical protein